MVINPDKGYFKVSVLNDNIFIEKYKPKFQMIGIFSTGKYFLSRFSTIKRPILFVVPWLIAVLR
jgi:hypothetical protein